LKPYLETEPAGFLLGERVQKTRRAKAPTIDYLVDINQDLYRTSLHHPHGAGHPEL